MFFLSSSVSVLDSFLDGWELVLIAAVILILLGAKRLPDLARGLGNGLHHFGKEVDEQARDAGESLGGIYGKPAAQALTPDNKTAELYDPGVLQEKSGTSSSRRGGFRKWNRFWRFLWHSALTWLNLNR